MIDCVLATSSLRSCGPGAMHLHDQSYRPAISCTACTVVVALYWNRIRGMARSRNVVDHATIEARREALKAELAHLDEQAKAAEQTARDAARPHTIRVHLQSLGRRSPALQRQPAPPINGTKHLRQQPDRQQPT